MRILIASLVAAGAALAWTQPASATASAPAPCTSAFIAANGTETFPGTDIGAVATGCQIGDLSQFNKGTGGAFVSTNSNPSIYEFFWGGGMLTISEKIGNNGVGDAIDVALDTLDSQLSTAPTATLASITIPFSSGPSQTYTVDSADLASGWYALDTSLAENNVADPNYQVNFAVPEPASLAVLGAGFLGLAGLRRRKRG